MSLSGGQHKFHRESNSILDWRRTWVIRTPMARTAAALRIGTLRTAPDHHIAETRNSTMAKLRRSRCIAFVRAKSWDIVG
jgi:hypothetical protein